MIQPPPPSGPPSAPAPGPPPPPHAVSNVDRSLLDIGSWLRDTTRTLARGFGDFFAVLALISLGATALSSPLLWFGSRGLVLTRDDTGNFGSVEGVSTGQGAMIFGGVVILLLAQSLLFAGATAHVNAVRSGLQPVWRVTMQNAARGGPRIVGVAMQLLLMSLLMLIVLGVLAVIVPGLALVAGPATLILLFLFLVRTCIALTHAGLGLPGSSIAGSFSWSRGRTWPLLGRLVLLTTIVFGLLLLASIVASPFQSLSGAATPNFEDDLILSEVIGSSIPAFLGGQLINNLASGFVAALWASAMLSIYRGEPVED